MSKRVLVVAVIFALALLLPVSAAPQCRTVQDMYEACTAPPASTDAAICTGYVSGVGDAMQFIGVKANQHSELRDYAICEQPSYGAMVQAFKNWADKHPQQWGANKIVGVMLALQENWGCH
jgi:hypothetical protein